MRASHWCATFVACVAFATSLTCLAQGQVPNRGPTIGVAPNTAPAAAPAARGPNIAVIDVKHIFDNNVRFKQAMDGIKQEYEAFENQVKQTEINLRKQIEELKALQAGSPEFKQLEESIAQTRTQVQLDINRKQKERVEEEAKVYHRAFQDVEAEIAKFSQRNGIDLVLQFSQSEIDPSKPDTVIRGLNRLVVYQNRLNITDYILQEINRGAPVPPVATNPNQPRTGQVIRPQGTVPSFPKTR